MKLWEKIIVDEINVAAVARVGVSSFCCRNPTPEVFMHHPSTNRSEMRHSVQIASLEKGCKFRFGTTKKCNEQILAF